MFSSSNSTTSTIPIDTAWANSVYCKCLDTCKKDQNFYIPDKQFDDNWAFQLFNKEARKSAKLKKKKTKKDHKKEQIPEKNEVNAICCPFEAKKNQCIAKWTEGQYTINQAHLSNHYEFMPINCEFKKDVLHKFNCSKYPWYITPKPLEPKKISYLKQIFCYPKIMVNLGWKIIHYKKILEYLDKGVRLFLIDLRYGSRKIHDQLNANIQKARNITAKYRKSKIIFGTAYLITGRALRTGLIYKNQKVFLDRDSKIILTSDRHYSHKCNHVVTYINFADFIQRFEIGDILKIGTSIQVQIEQIGCKSIICMVITEGLLQSSMPVIIPINRSLEEPPKISKEEEDNVAMAFQYQCDFIICSCTYSPNVITHIHWVMATFKRCIGIFARVTMNSTMLQVQIDFIMKECHGIWFDGNGCNENIPLRDYTVKLCFRKQKLIFRTGLMLDSTPNSLNTSTPKDAKSLKHFFLYPDCLVIDRNIYDTINVRERIRINYPKMNKYNFELSCGPLVRTGKCMFTLFCNNLITAALDNQVSCIIFANNNGKSVFWVSKNRPMVPIIASFYDIATARSMCVLRNVYPCLYWDSSTGNWEKQIQNRLAFSIELAKLYKFVNNNQNFLFCFDSKRGLEFSDSYRILKLEHF